MKLLIVDRIIGISDLQSYSVTETGLGAGDVIVGAKGVPTLPQTKEAVLLGREGDNTRYSNRTVGIDTPLPHN